jgi:radical SAM superfamily enzyme YgiQ (UPF0313 family)
MYKDKQFKVKSLDIIERDLKEISIYNNRIKKLFLMDGDALIIKQSRLVEILRLINHYLPDLDRISTYANTRSILLKSDEQLKELKELKLKMVYQGVESGDDTVLQQINKNANRREHIESAKKLKNAGITHSVMVLLGIGGKKHTLEHAKNTATMLTEMNPEFVGALTLMLVPQTELYNQSLIGEFVLPDKFELLKELKTIIQDSDFTNCRFSSNHASNYLPIKIDLPQNKKEVLYMIDNIISQNSDANLKPEWLRGL